MSAIDTPDLFAPHKCAFCNKHGAAFRVEINPPDESTEVFKFFCASGCLANYGTNQPRPKHVMVEAFMARGSE